MAFGAGLLLFLALTLPKLIQVWTTGAFLNPDDAMRAVEVRDFMGGQGWFDLVPHRLSPNQPFVMHWSRLIDAPLAAMVWLFALVLQPADAELAMRIVEPVLLFMAALWLMLGIMRDLIGTRAMLPAALLLASSIEFVGNFLPGHIHHHAAQATLLLGTARLTLAGLQRERAGWTASLAGIGIAFSLGIGLQSLPFMIGVAAIFAADWAWRGESRGPAMAGFGAGLTAGAVAVFLLDVPPSLYAQGSCDAFSAAHLIAASLGGMGLLALASLPTVKSSRNLRFLCLAALGASVVGVLHATYPACLHDPMAGVDPVLRDRWLADVGEALPLIRFITLDPPLGIVLTLTLAVGLGATILALREMRCSAGPWLALLLLAVIGLAGTAYQVRVAASTCAFLVPGLAWLVLRVFDAIARQPKRPALLAAIVVGLAGNGAGLTAMAKPIGRLLPPAASAKAAHVDPSTCFEPAAYAGLRDLPPGLVLSTIDPGSTILAYTHHAALAAPYHRNSYGNRLALIALAAPAGEALPMIRAAQVDYLMLCRGSNETAETVAQHPNSLSAVLMSGAVPPGLIPIRTDSGRMLIFRVEKM